jgi:hypothetical protein
MRLHPTHKSGEAAEISEEVSRGRMSRLIRRVGRFGKSSLAVVGAAAVAGVYLEYKSLYPSSPGDEKKKKALFIPFHRIQLADKHKKEWKNTLSSFDGDNETRPLNLEVKELVDLIHHAASDPDIVALYGVFGHGSSLPSADWANLEEVRCALKVSLENAHDLYV